MIVHILPPSATFKAVRYNTDKIDSGKGELMKVSGFGALAAYHEMRPDDFRNLLQAQSCLNKRVKFPQFHAVISAKGKSHGKEELTELATQWLEGMGYGKQPYLIIFHKDTANHHVHIVTTRVDAAGKKISSGFERIRAVNTLNRLMGLDEGRSAKQDLSDALTYRFSTMAQFKLLLEAEGYVVREREDLLELIRFGKVAGSITKTEVEQRFAIADQKPERVRQLKAIFREYAAQYDTTLRPVDTVYPDGPPVSGTAYTSDIARMIRDRLGIQLIFHASADKPPYGYTIIDHAQKLVLKGGSVLSLKDMLGQLPGHKPERLSRTVEPTEEEAAYYRAMVLAALRNYPDLRQGLNRLGYSAYCNAERFHLVDRPTETRINLTNHFSLPERLAIEEALRPVHENQIQISAPAISDDIDDEAIHGRNRRRKRKARTNHR